TQSNLRVILDRVEQVDDYTVRVFTKTPQPYLPTFSSVNSPAQGQVMPKDYIEKNGAEYFSRNPVGAGPWRLTRVVSGDLIEYEAVTNHWRKTPAFKKLTLFQVPEASTRLAMLKTGEADAANVSLEDAVAMEKAGYSAVELFGEQPRGQFHGTYDPRAAGTPLTDIRVRQALTIAINHDELARTLFQGKAGRIMPPNLFYGMDDIDSDLWASYSKDFYKYDPDKARQLLAQAGYPGAFGNPTIKLYVFSASGSPYLPKLDEIVAAYWQRVGMKVDLVPVDFATWLTWRKEPAMQLVGNASITRGPILSPAPVLLTSMWGNNDVYRLTGGAGGKNYMPIVDELLVAASKELDPVKRKKILADFIKIAMDTWTSFPFPTVPSMMVAGSKVKFDLPYPLVVSYVGLYADYASHK
ncbi:MAG: ABC transporter substrate-binding protein, partial [Chloroflexi bacterium]|nr:ABC transporter substrate-binding protein [Chloroflexota bacterium]